MKVIIIRHGKVNYNWKRKYSSKEFDRACGEYDQAPIMRMSYDIPTVDCQQLYVSELARSRDTAIEIFGNKLFMKTELANEVPLRSGFDTEMKLPVWFWNITGRLQWYFGSKRQSESRKETEKRARRFIELWNAEEGNPVVISHGFYMHSLLKEMKRAGFKIDNVKLKYRNGNYVVAERGKNRGEENCELE